SRKSYFVKNSVPDTYRDLNIRNWHFILNLGILSSEDYASNMLCRRREITY
ncbi:hypothetical protein LINGRAHAP2_LOCUS18199, partial [Linum grandiflorum]